MGQGSEGGSGEERGSVLNRETACAKVPRQKEGQYLDELRKAGREEG